MAKKGKKSSSHKSKISSAKENINVNYKGGDVDYASKVSGKSSSSGGKSFKKNILDDFIRGADRGNRLTSEMRKFSDLTGYAWNPEAILNSEGITTSRLTSKE